jgi:hypothetical protein
MELLFLQTNMETRGKEKKQRLGMSKRIKTTINHNGSSNNLACVPVVVLCNWEELNRLGDAIAQSTCAQLHRPHAQF